MTTPDPDDATDGRRVRPQLKRTGPQRSILNAFFQPDGSHRVRPGRARFEDDNVWGACGHAAGGTRDDTDASAGRDGPEEGPADHGEGTRPLWSDAFEAVRSAYGVVDDQIRAGYEEAARLSDTAGAPTGKRVSKILNRLVQTYSDLGSQWVDLLLATAEGRERAPGASAPSAAPADMSVAVEVTTVRPARARALLYRPLTGAARVFPLRREGGDGEIAEVSVEPGPVVSIRIAAGTPPGLYRGIIVEEGVEEPAGSVIVTVMDGADG